MIEKIDSRHWSQRWMRCAQSGSDAVVMFDLYQPLDIHGCGRGKCDDLQGKASTRGPRYRVTRFWEMETCPYCGRPFGYARQDHTLYLGDSFEEAFEAYSAAEMSFFGYEASA